MEHQIIAEVSVVPLGVGTGVSRYVANCLKALDEVTDISHQLTPMGTVILGPLSEVMKAVQKMHEVPFDMGAQRVVTTIKIDDRRDKVVTMDSKVKSVVEKS